LLNLHRDRRDIAARRAETLDAVGTTRAEPGN